MNGQEGQDNKQESQVDGTDKPAAGERFKIAEVIYDKADMIESDVVTIRFHLTNMSHMSYGVDLVIGRMERIKEDLAFIILEKQARRVKLENPAGPIKIVQ